MNSNSAVTDHKFTI